ncbi:MAG: hypothetical protein Q4E86_10690, partial [Lachnospiraceae bacterium]|nr:hypothetical protein [Lachnospiraceae bacterium]
MERTQRSRIKLLRKIKRKNITKENIRVFFLFILRRYLWHYVFCYGINLFECSAVDGSGALPERSLIA